MSLSGVGVARWVLSRGFLALPCVRFSVLYSDTLSVRDVGLVPRPTGSLTARVLVNGGSALPRVSTSLLVFRPSSPGSARPLSHQLISAEPRTLTATRPLGQSPAFPHLEERRVYLVDSFIAHDPQHNAQTTSLALTPSGHTFSGQLTVPILMVEGRHLAFTSFLVLVHRFNWLAPYC